MSIPASQVLSAIDSAIGDVRGDESKLSTVLGNIAAEISRLRTREAEGFKTLARVRLDTIARDAEIGEIDATERRALTLIDRHKAKLERLWAERETLIGERARCQAARDARVRELETASHAVDARELETESRLANAAEMREAQARVVEAKAVAERARTKADRSEADMLEKRQPYEADALFMYLWNHKFGTSGYEAGFLARFFDRKVARLVGYDQARPNFAMLNEIPPRLREHAERQIEAVKAAEQAIDQIERQALEAAGIVPLETARAAAAKAVMDAEADLAFVETKLVELDAREAEAASGDPAYVEAVDMMSQTISRRSLQALLAEALKTPTPEDERAVRDIGDSRKEIKALEEEAARTRALVTQTAAKRAELERSRDQFRRSGYDDVFGSFVNDAAIMRLIGGFVSGAISALDLDGALRDGYRRRQTSSWNDRRRNDSSWSGGSSWGGGGGSWGGGGGGSWGGGGGGGGSSSGGSGGGGFSTGGGF